MDIKPALKNSGFYFHWAPSRCF